MAVSLSSKGRLSNWFKKIMSAFFAGLELDLIQLINQIRLLPAYIFVIISILYFSLPMPATRVFHLFFGYVFGLTQGFLLGILAYTLGTYISFMLFRKIFKKLGHRYVSKYINLIDEDLEKMGFIDVMSMRGMPIIPAFAVNAFFAVTNISIKKFMFASFIASIPLTIFYCYLGSMALEIMKMPTLSIWVVLFFVVLALLPQISRYLKIKKKLSDF